MVHDIENTRLACARYFILFYFIFLFYFDI